MTGPLDGLDAPRPLSEALRARLEDALLGSVEARPLSEEQESTLAAALRDPVGELLSGLDAPRPLPAALRRGLEQDLVRRRRAWLVPAAAASVAAVAVGALVLQGAGAPARRTGLPSRPSSSPSSVVVPPLSGAGGLAGTSGTSGGALPSSPVPAPVVAGGPPPAVVGSGGNGSTGSTGGGTTGTAVTGTTGQPAPPAPPPPTLDAISPTSGSPGTWVILTGTSLTPTVSVVFGTTRAVEVEQVSATRVRARAPQHLPGPVQVVLTTRGGSTGGKQYLYLP